MDDRPRISKRPAGGCDLQNAARVASRDHVGRGCRDVPCLSCAELAGRFGLHQVIDPSAAAADLRLGWCEQLNTWYRLQQRPGLRTNPLAMREVAGVVIDDARVNRVSRRAWSAKLAEHLGHISNAGT